MTIKPQHGFRIDAGPCERELTRGQRVFFALVEKGNRFTLVEKGNISAIIISAQPRNDRDRTWELIGEIVSHNPRLQFTATYFPNDGSGTMFIH